MVLFVVLGLSIISIIVLTILGSYWYNKASEEWEEDKIKYLEQLRWLKKGYHI